MNDIVKLLPCPFCARPVDDDLIDTLYPTGAGWKRISEGVHAYGRWVDGFQDGEVWSMNCSESCGGCGAEISGDTREEAMAKWNRREPAPGSEDNVTIHKDFYFSLMRDAYRWRAMSSLVTDVWTEGLAVKRLNLLLEETGTRIPAEQVDAAVDAFTAALNTSTVAGDYFYDK